MLSIDEALGRILTLVEPLEPALRPLCDALGEVLAEDIVSTIDSPPFDKSLMDGYAVQSASCRKPSGVGGIRLRVVEEVTAGRMPTRPVGPGEATRIMTGAPLPEGVDAVVKIEETALVEGEETAGRSAGDVFVEIWTESVVPGQNLMRRGTSMQKGETILSAGRVLRPQEIGALAEIGKRDVLVHPRPTVAVLSTGDELVTYDQTPGPGQIRNSNEPMLLAQVAQANCRPVPLGIARDVEAELETKVREGLKADMLILSGGVSAGKLDLVPKVLSKCGVREVFHKVDVKPGKPVWFGVLEEECNQKNRGENEVRGRYRLIFGLPGNPVSSMVCFELFAKTALRRLRGLKRVLPQSTAFPLGESFENRESRPTYFPCIVQRRNHEGENQSQEAAAVATVRLVAWKGSADLRSTVDANGMVLLPAGFEEIPAGTELDVFLWKDDEGFEDLK